jgi:Protein of unknown function (DUF3644)
MFCTWRAVVARRLSKQLCFKESLVVTKRNRSIGSLAEELIAKSRESALSAIRVFNDPQVSFKSETYIVLMVIAWTYMLHAYFRKNQIEYRYFSQTGNRRKFDKTKSGAFKFWELERCLNCDSNPIDNDASNNLKFLIGLRHEIEHQMTRSLDHYLSGRYQACAMNYNFYLKNLFGERYGLDSYLAFSLQFSEISEEQMNGPQPEVKIPVRLRSYIVKFDQGLTADEHSNSKFSYKLLFKKQLVNRVGQADRVVEFIDPKSDLALTIDRAYWVKKEVEKPKFRPKDVVAKVREAGYTRFRVQPDHLLFWKSEDAKNTSKGYGVDVSGAWYWYESWVQRCIELCKNDQGKYA